jgi:hypothetical protein
MALRLSWKPRRPMVLFGALGSVIVLILAAAALFDDLWRDKSMPIQGTPAPTISAAELNTVDRTRVFFGHQSVGENVLSGVPAVYASQDLEAPPIERGGTQPGPAGGFISHELIGENDKPLLKIEDFDKIMRGGMADRVDVAMMKLCYIDITSSTDVDAVFARYRDTVRALQRDYPNVAFVHVTLPLTTEPTIKAKVKTMLGGSDRFGQAENAVRERYNTLIRNEFESDHIFDLAAIESTAPDGKQDARSHNGQQYFSMYNEYASDLGHLNAVGSEIAATAFLRAIAQASAR